MTDVNTDASPERAASPRTGPTTHDDVTNSGISNPLIAANLSDQLSNMPAMASGKAIGCFGLTEPGECFRWSSIAIERFGTATVRPVDQLNIACTREPQSTKGDQRIVSSCESVQC